MDLNSPKKIVFFGDSVTEGCFELYPTSYGFDTVRHPDKAYPSLVTHVLKEKYGENIISINAGLSGDSSKNGLERTERDVLSHKPDIVTIAFGLNDIFRPEHFEKSINGILKKITASGAKAVLVTPNMLNTYIHEETLPSALKVARTAMAAQTDGTLDQIYLQSLFAAKHFGAEVCDVYLFWKNLYFQGVDITSLLVNKINHPCEKMHIKTAEMLLQTIEKL